MLKFGDIVAPQHNLNEASQQEKPEFIKEDSETKNCSLNQENSQGILSLESLRSIVEHQNLNFDNLQKPVIQKNTQNQNEAFHALQLDEQAKSKRGVLKIGEHPSNVDILGIHKENSGEQPIPQENQVCDLKAIESQKNLLAVIQKDNAQNSKRYLKKHQKLLKQSSKMSKDSIFSEEQGRAHSKDFEIKSENHFCVNAHKKKVASHFYSHKKSQYVFNSGSNGLQLSKRIRSETKGSMNIQPFKNLTDPFKRNLSLEEIGSKRLSCIGSNFQNISTLSFYDDKQLIAIEENIQEECDVSLLEVSDWIKFVCLILKLNKSVYNKITRLVRRVVSERDPFEVMFYYSGACVAIYGKIQCQNLFPVTLREFPAIPKNSEHKRMEIEALHPILEIKQLRMAEFQVSEVVGFNFEIQDFTKMRTEKVCSLWCRYVDANRKAIPLPLHYILIGTKNHEELRNLLFLVYVMDFTEFVPELIEYQIDAGKTYKEINAKLEAQMTLKILLCIYIVGSYNCPQGMETLVKRFSKNVIKFDQVKVQELEGLMQKAEKLKINQIIKRVHLKEIFQLEPLMHQMNDKQKIDYVHQRTLRMKHFGKTLYHQDLQWFV